MQLFICARIIIVPVRAFRPRGHNESSQREGVR